MMKGYFKANKKELLIEGIAFAIILFLAFYWSNNAYSTAGRFVSAVKVVIVCVVPPYLIVNRFVTPRYLLKKRYKMFAVWVACIMLLNPVWTYLAGRWLNDIFLGGNDGHNKDVIARSLYIFFWNTLLAISAAIGLRLLSFYSYTEKRILQLEKQQLEAELHFLQSQINPHFIFNVMNTIYFQIDETNSNARLTVENFADLIRYQLRVSEQLYVNIEDEISYLKNYCEIQKLRLEANTALKMHFGSGLSGFEITPFLILPLIENAFKHISHVKPPQKNELVFSVMLDEGNLLKVHTENTIDEDSAFGESSTPDSGFGLVNLKRRLDLIYAGRYILHTEKRGHQFFASLSIRL